MVSLKKLHKSKEADADEHHKIGALFHRLKIHGNEDSQLKRPTRVNTIAAVGRQKSRSSSITPTSAPAVLPSSTNKASADPRDRGLHHASTSLGTISAKPKRKTSDTPRPRAATASLATAPHGLPSIDAYKPKIHKMTYNPYGINSDNSRVSTTSSKFMVDCADDEDNILPYPVESPNDHLPDSLKEHDDDVFDEYQLVDKNNIGSGASASVKRICKKQHTKEVYALKKFILFKGETPAEFYERATKEYMIQHNLNAGLHITNCHALVKVPHQQNLTRGWGLVLELCKTDLFDVISKPTFQYVSTAEKFCLFKQIAYGLKYVHESDIVHRDMKPENILMTSDGIIKITDFGVATYGHEVPGDFTSPIALSTQLVGSPPYQPPEIEAIKGLPPDKRKPYDPFSMDDWALGVILFTLFYCTTPFESASDDSAAYRDYSMSWNDYVKKNKDFLTSDRRGPGLEYRYAKQFRNTGISRIAWRLTDPDPKTRYCICDVFCDREFQQAEMCVPENDYGCNFCHRPVCYEEHFKHPYGEEFDKATNKFSRSSTLSSSIGSARSRAGTNQSLPKVKSMLDVQMPKVKSMLAIAEGSAHRPKISEKIAEDKKALEMKADKLHEHVQEEKDKLVQSLKKDDAPNGVEQADHEPNGAAEADIEPTTTENDDQKTIGNDSCDCKGSDHSSIHSDSTASIEHNEKANGDQAETSATTPSTDEIPPPRMSQSSVIDIDGPSTIGQPKFLDCLFTPDSTNMINLANNPNRKYVPTAAIKAASSCKIKEHEHLSRW